MELRSVSLTEPSHWLLTTLKWVFMGIDQQCLRPRTEARKMAVDRKSWDWDGEAGSRGTHQPYGLPEGGHGCDTSWWLLVRRSRAIRDRGLEP